ncbi:ficolin-1-like [Drosophila montana]|uniref:ficolin-1-like n=1 Tax=Drosophila montana TaxID=40370 RepID=UPI00313E137B
MLLKIICTVYLLNMPVLKCENENVENFTVKYGNLTEVLFQIKDNKIHLQHLQLEVLRMEQMRQGALLDELVAKLKSLEPTQFTGSCAEAAALSRRSGVYQILVPGYSLHPFIVRCDEDTQGGAWTTVLRREDGSVDFFRFWKDYKNGFGNAIGEFFIGLDKLHFMTKVLDQELLITMEDFKGQHRFAKYDRFAIDNENEAYKMKTLGTYSGDATDCLREHAGQKFSSRDRDNDQHIENCAEKFTGGWWYNRCHVSNLMGVYNDSTFGKGINWRDFTSHTASLKRVQMMIRPRRY